MEIKWQAMNKEHEILFKRFLRSAAKLYCISHSVDECDNETNEKRMILIYRVFCSVNCGESF